MLRTEFLLPFGIWRSGHIDDRRNRYITSNPIHFACPSK
jgi:hypothetical protein